MHHSARPHRGGAVEDKSSWQGCEQPPGKRKRLREITLNVLSNDVLYLHPSALCSVIHSFRKYLLNMFYVPQTVLDTGYASDVALPSQDLTVLWVTKQEREQEEAVVAAAPSLVHTDFDHHDVGTQYVLNKMPVCELSQTATSLRGGCYPSFSGHRASK